MSKSNAQRQKEYQARKWVKVLEMPKIPCGCGCGEMIPPLTKQFKPATYKLGHNPSGEETRFKKGRKTWNKGKFAQESHMYKGGHMSTGESGRQYFWVSLHPDEGEDHPTYEPKKRRILRSHLVWNTHNPDNKVQPGQHIHHMNNDSLHDVIKNLHKFDNPGDHISLHSTARARSKERNRRGQFISNDSQ